ncbi:carbohydrate binding domain-containing protein [Frigoribacterium sp. PhB118]|uniref:carbohydrate binding domain-containing protein n=1 Tax=Frigoribacterium sp. PhB118 TaxID=2485175 RepID=UPI000FAB10CA|nr:carbohydrate binding domain-containing protein [Frigoribacterium sp. PhB118]ROS57197.1 carbohydrate binding protein [Frigoribacterium sp. PhB118]
MICTRTYTATLRTAVGKTYPLNIVDGSAGLSEARAPYASASLTIAHPGLTVLAALDPTLLPRVTLTLSSTPGATRTLDLYVSARQLDTAAARVGLNLSGDELLLQDYKRVATEPYRNLWINQGSVADIVSIVLSTVYGGGAAWKRGAWATRPIPTYSAAKNLIPVGSFEVPSGVWIATNVALSQSSTRARIGTNSLRMVPNTANVNDSYASLNPGLEPGKTYRFNGSVWCAALSGTVNARALSVVVLATVAGTTRQVGYGPANLRNQWVDVFAEFTIPENATYSEVRIYNGAASGGGDCWWDALSIYEGDGRDTNGISPIPYFDGDTPDTETYRYDWDAAAGLSPSTRTPVLDRDPELLTWSPGQSAWEYLTPILQAVGLRLFCDETRTWQLVDDNYAVAGTVRAAAGTNLYAHTDLMSRTATQTDGLPLFCDAVVIAYTWRDRAGDERTQYDIAGTTNPTKAYVIERPDTAFPGAGTAAYVLRRLQARQKQQTATAAIDFAATPGMSVAITSGAADALTGYLDAVEWNLTADDMQLVSKGLIVVASGSIGRAPADQTIGSVTTDLAGYTN